MRGEHYQPSLSDRDSREEWVAKGGKLTWERAAERVDELTASRDWSLPAGVRERVLSEIKDIVD